MKIRVVLADDQSMVRAGFRMILETEPDIEVVGEAEDGIQAVSVVQKTLPDVILMDIQMPVLDGLEATRRILQTAGQNNTKVLILTTFEREEYIFEAIKLGASGFLLKNASPEDLISAVKIVAEGNALLAPSVTKRIIAEFAYRHVHYERKDDLKKLTDREIDVLRLLAKGLTNNEIANLLFVSEATIKTHVSNLLTKIDLRDRVQAVVFAYESGLVLPGNT